MKQLNNLIGGKWVAATGSESYTLLDPSDGRTPVASLRLSSTSDVSAAVAAAARAFPSWRATPVVKRCRILLSCKELLEQRMDALAELLVRENGKTRAEAEGSLRRGFEVVEFAAGMPSLAKGDFIEDIAAGVDSFIYREPLGVVVGACPFNFPAMIPLWMFPVAIACGNTFVLKPSEKCPATATALAEIFSEGGLPPGVLNVVQGGRDIFEALIASPDVKAVSFVGSTPAARNVWQLGTKAGKRVQALGGAKNHVVVMPDADGVVATKGIVEAAYGCAGERCMATSVVVLVGPGQQALDDMVAAAKALRLGSGLDAKTQMGPVVSAEHKHRVEDYIRIGVEEGARLILDGRGVSVPGLPDGHFVGPTIFDGVTPEMRIAREEIFGPVLAVMRAPDLDAAIDLCNKSPFGNGASIFTRSGFAAREFRGRINCGMIGINAGVPAPMAFFSFGGDGNSIFGDLRAHGPDAVEFYTKKKAVIERWADDRSGGNIWGR